MPVDRNTNACWATATVQRVERVEIRVGQLAAAERSAGGAVRGDRVDHGVDRAEVGADVGERRAQLLRIGRVGLQLQRAALTHARQRVVAARDAGGVPPELHGSDR